MGILYHLSVALSIVLFMYYGMSCLVSDAMTAEFERFSLSQFRRLTGGLEVLGALGLLVGYLVPPLVLVASGGLTVLMLLGIAMRIRALDALKQTLPAAFLMMVNAYIFVCALAVVLKP